MSYLLISIAVICIAAQFSLAKVYQVRYAKGTASLLQFPIVTAAFGGLLFVVINLIQNGYALRFGGFTFFMALGMGLVTMCSGILSILVMRLGKISVYTIFMMLGGMMLPFFVGLLFLGEVPTPARIVGIVILAVSLFLPFVRFGGKKANAQAPQSPEEAPKPKRTRIIFILFCAAVFLLNGCTSVLNKLHQINQAALDTNNYIIWQDIFSLTFSVLVYGGYLLTAHKKRAAEAVAFEGAALPTDGETAKTPNLRVFFPGLAVIALYAAISGGGGLLLLLSAKDLPASVLYPMVTGGSIVLTSLFGRLFFKEKMDLQLILSLALTVVGTVLFLF